jgi:hypothetical protein
LNIVFVLLGTRDSFVRIVHLATKEIQRDWDLLVHVFHVTAKGEGLAIQTQVSEMTPGPGGWGCSQVTGVPCGRDRYPAKLISEMAKD